MSLVPILPKHLSRVQVPFYFSPSAWRTLEACPVRVWGSEPDLPLLPESPDALLGTLLHDCRKRFAWEWHGEGSAKALVRTILAEELGHLERKLAASESASLVPFRAAIDWYRWTDRTQRLFQWADTQAPARVAAPTPKADQPHGGADGEVGTKKDAFALGVEQWWASTELRLRGRPDVAELAADGAVEISDFKTGNVLDEDGGVSPWATAQLQLYALMAEYLRPGTSVRIFVAQSRRVSVPWGASERDAITQKLRQMSEQYPVGAEHDAFVTANPGPHCIGCRIRHLCRRYLETAPAWWPNGAGCPRPLPFDVWGNVQSVAKSTTGWRVVLRDPVGRRVQIEGLKAERELESLSSGSELFLFGLEPAEDVAHHGMAIHPLNFYEVAPAPPWRSARSLLVFRAAVPR